MTYAASALSPWKDDICFEYEVGLQKSLTTSSKGTFSMIKNQT